MREDIKKTDKLIFDLKLRQIDFNEQKKNSLRHEISEKYGVPIKNVEVNLIPMMKTETIYRWPQILLTTYKTQNFNSNYWPNILNSMKSMM